MTGYIPYQSPNKGWLNAMFQFMGFAMVGAFAVAISKSVIEEMLPAKKEKLLPATSKEQIRHYHKASPWVIYYRYRGQYYDGTWTDIRDGTVAAETQYWIIFKLSELFYTPRMQILSADLYHKGKHIRSFTSAPLTEEETLKIFLYGSKEKRESMKRKIRGIVAKSGGSSGERVPSETIRLRYRINWYGPRKHLPQEMHRLWARVLGDVEKQYPLSDFRLLRDAKKLEITPRELQLFIAHDKWADHAETHKFFKKYRLPGEEEDEEEREVENNED